MNENTSPTQPDPNAPVEHTPGNVYDPASGAIPEPSAVPTDQPPAVPELPSFSPVDTPAPAPEAVTPLPETPSYIPTPEATPVPPATPDTTTLPKPTIQTADLFASSSPVPKPKASKKRLILIVGVVVAVLLAVGGGVYAFKSMQKKNAPPTTRVLASATTPVGCTAPVAAKVDQTSGIAAFKTFSQAIKASDQTCVDTLSSSYLVQYQNKIFADAAGKWITAKPVGVPSITERFSQLPITLTNANFTQENYTRTVNVGENTPSASGLTLTYPLNGTGGINYNLNISFIAEKGKVVADKLELEPITQAAKP